MEQEVIRPILARSRLPIQIAITVWSERSVNEITHVVAKVPPFPGSPTA